MSVRVGKPFISLLVDHCSKADGHLRGEVIGNNSDRYYQI